MRIFTSALIAVFFFTSCSISKRIDRVAKQTILSDQHFQNAHTGIAVYDPSTSKFIFDYQGDKYFTPASNTKLASCYAAMKYLGDSIPGLFYHVENDSTITIKGTGDPTFLHRDFSNQPALDLLKAYKMIHIVAPEFHQYLGNGWSWNDYTEDYMAPRSQMPLYGNTAKFYLSPDGNLTISPDYFTSSTNIDGSVSNGFSVDRPWSSNQFTVISGRQKSTEVPFVPTDSTLLFLLADTLHSSVDLVPDRKTDYQLKHSQSLDSMLAIMMHRSDNFFAEQSLLMVSEKLLGKMNDRLIVQQILSTEFKDMPQQPSWVDGSGLSRYNLFSPKDFVFILQKMKNEFGLERMKAILPTGGTGTIASLYKEDSGFIFVKTGTLNGVVALSGYLYTKKNKLLLFSVLVNNHRSSSADIRKGIEKFIQSLRNQF